MNFAHLQQKLFEERRQYEDQIEMIKETGLGDLSHGDQLQEDSTVDNHPADLGTEMFEREKDLGLRSNAMRRLREIDIALERMTSGLYGTCTECGGAIDEERLEVFPSATTCIRCQQLREAPADRFHRPIEEQVLNPPWGRSWRDGSGDPGYDGEDAWQEVAQYGTSETPSDVPGAVKYSDMYQNDEEVYTIVDHMDALVDEDGEPIQRDDRDAESNNGTDWAAGPSSTLYGADEALAADDYRWEVAAEFHGVMPEHQFRRGQFPRRRMPR
ncbi:MAG TPA: TraR/DksA C4-type zinc finger protein [Symbiobacteriaceae bacterium]|nr:TraR/DksA C4-type zinc finger protein [Symbiobacteriaceae bacterium]